LVTGGGSGGVIFGANESIQIHLLQILAVIFNLLMEQNNIQLMLTVHLLSCV
jgi:hypothetical protein